MGDDTLLLRATFEIKEEALEAFTDHARALMASARSEEGVLSYEVLQDPDRPGRHVFLEEYADDDAMRAHMASELVQSYLRRLPAWLAAPAVAQVCGLRRLDRFSIDPA
ncbi:putative quinol monooxygenase [Planomonospora sp. ID82291]|uniref:putative quinol monooxygenase n=1 Tax=Planomonospora sp. ID82291 TaxID=2738136 RepID=UPI0018C3D95C|nr:putative quinol monooxygenase [Planomonospora sp. ID82291]MBG0814133.1 antibiotic biosynthesis monooxygenase [Planomonospora sp. ID82291]